MALVHPLRDRTEAWVTPRAKIQERSSVFGRCFHRSAGRLRSPASRHDTRPEDDTMKRYRVLAVEDDPGNKLVLANIFRLSGCIDGIFEENGDAILDIVGSRSEEHTSELQSRQYLV